MRIGSSRDLARAPGRAGAARWLKTGIAAGLATLLPALPARAADVWSPGLSLTAEERYDDDLLLRSDDGTGGGQLMTKLTPEVSLAAKAHTWGLDVSYAPDLFLRHGSGTRSIDHRFAWEAHRKLDRRFSLETEGRVWYVSDPTSLPRMGMARALVPVLYGVGDVAASWSASRRWLWRADYRFEGTRIEEPGRLPGFLHQPTLQALFRVDARTELGLDYRLQSFIFDQARALSHGPAALLRHRLGRNLRLSLSGGASWYREDGDAGRAGWVPRATLTLDGNAHHLVWGLAAGHDLVGASGFTTALWADFAAATAGWHLTRELQLRAMGNLFRNGPAPGVRAFRFGADDGVSQGYGVAGALEWQVQPRWALQLQVTRIGQMGNADVAAPELTRNIAAIRAVFTPWD